MNDIAMQVAIHGYNLDSRCQADQSLQELSDTDYPLDLLQKENIKELARKYFGSSGLGGLARIVVKKVELMEMKEKVRMARKRSADGSESSGSSRTSPASSRGSPNLDENLIVSKKTMPTVFVPKSKTALPLKCPQNLKTIQASQCSQKKAEADEKLKKFLEKKRSSQGKVESEMKEVSNVKKMLEEAKKKRFEEAEKAKVTGSWGEMDGGPKAKKTKFQKRK